MRAAIVAPVLVLGLAVGPLFGSASAVAQASLEKEAARIHREAIVVDMHADSLPRILDAKEDLGTHTPRGDIDIPRLREGGVDCQFLAIWPAPVFKSYGFLKRSLDMIDAYDGFVQSHPDQLVAARTVAEIRSAAVQGKIATLIGISW